LKLCRNPEYESPLIHKQPIILFIIKLVVELFAFGLCLSFALYSIITYQPSWTYTVYLTNWTLTITTTTFFLCAATSLERLIRKIIYNITHKEYSLVPGELLELCRDRFYNVSLPAAIFVAFAFWTLVYTPGSDISYSTVGAHAVSAVFIVFEFFFSTTYFYWWDFMLVFGYTVFYCVFGVYHYHARGIWVYTVLDPVNNPKFWLVYIIAYVAILGIWFVAKFLSLTRNHIVYLIWKRCKKLPEQEPLANEEGIEGVVPKVGAEVTNPLALDERTARNNLISSLLLTFVTVLFSFTLMMMFYYGDSVFYDAVGNPLYEVSFFTLTMISLLIGAISFAVPKLFFGYLITSVPLSLFVIVRFITDAYYVGQNMSYKISSYYGGSMALCIIIYINMFLSWIATLIYVQKKVKMF
jgi:hypothetical protein